jgi:phasin family protein
MPQETQKQQTLFLELYRAGLRTASDITKASIENAQRLHTQQMEAFREALEANAESTQRLSDAHSIPDLMALQARMAGIQAERAADFWTRAWRTATESQVAMLDKVQNQVGQFSEQMRETYSAATRVVESAANNSAEAAREAERKAHRKAS